MRIAIFGLGYVGCVSSACFARDGFSVIGVDINKNKVADIRVGKSPIIEPGLGELLLKGVTDGRISATINAKEAIAHADIAMICVGTPSQKNGALDFQYIERVCQDIGDALAEKPDYMVVAVRSTILPGSASKRLIPILETTSQKTVGRDFGFCVNPEFLREGSAIDDFDYPPYTVIGQYDAKSGETLSRLYSQIDAPLFRVPLGEAEMVKYASNAFHALKVVFANEIGNICKLFDVDSHKVMDIFVQDKKLNISPKYLKPGFAFGGSCLGKDLRALLYTTRQQGISTPILNAIIPSNQLQIQKVLNLLLQLDKNKVALIGLSFKPNTDDLRESPAVELAERLIGKGFELAIYDHEVSLSKLHGSNRSYIDDLLPHISSHMRSSLRATIEFAEAIVITKKLSEEESDVLFQQLQPKQILIDLIHLNGKKLNKIQGAYHGICW
ncbi:MAG: UDP-glucose/GDP-mannose dehydrogenase family protein [Anaerolineales bacterium]|jgi:GDP-mannose 6-dehydrogenase